MSDKTIYTHDAAASIVELFETILGNNGIIIASPEDDEREEDNAAPLYGSVYSELLDDVEETLIEMLERAREGCDIVPYEFSGNY